MLGVVGLHGLLFGLVLVAFLAIRRRWRTAAVRGEEVLRLLAMASDDTAMAEAELEETSLHGDSSFAAAPPPFHCAVCYLPTTMRCSRCKSVRYCSGKCQIFHWRQNHKDECRHYSIQFQNRNELSGQFNSSYDKEGTETYSTSSSGPCDLWDDKLSKDISGSDTHDRLEKPPFDGIGPHFLGRTANIKEMKVTESPPSNSAKFSMECVSHINASNKMVSNHGDENMKSTLRVNKAKIGKHENGLPSTNFYTKKLTKATHLADKLTKDMAKSTSSSFSNDENFCAFKCKEDQASPFVASNDDQSSSSGEHFFSGSKSAKTDDYHTLLAKSTSIPPNACNGLKTSTRKVVQQFRSSKQSKIDTSSPRSEIPGKHKLIFPYELFVKLYTHEMTILGPFGLTNCGNSCYANAVLQCLAFTRPLTSYLCQGLHSKSCRNKDWCFICEFEYLIYKAREGTSPLSPIKILSKIHKIGSHLGHGREEDAHEFLRYAVDTMQSIFLNNAGAVGPLAEESTLVGMTFGGYLLSKIKCMRCLGKSEQCERMMDLTVEIAGEIGTLEEALAQFTATETLDRDNKYRCSRCKSYEKARKKLTVLEAPNILTIVLKRFKSGNFEKLSKSVRFPEVLDMAPYMSRKSERPPLYSLYAMVVHLDIMNASFTGHYVCYVKNVHGKWFKIDDSTVEPVELERVLSEEAYMLLYSRRSPRPPAMLGGDVVVHGGKSKKRNLEAVPSAAGKSKSLSNSRMPTADLAAAQQKFSPGPYNWRLNPMHRVRGADSSSESSSLFSCSDASSSSTVSTKDSASTDDFSDYIFGEAGNRFYRHYGHSSGTVASTLYSEFDTNLNCGNDIRKRFAPQGSGAESEWEGNSAILYTDATKHRRKSTSQLDRSCSRETDFTNGFWANPFDVKTAVSSRRVNGERSAQTFYEV